MDEPRFDPLDYVSVFNRRKWWFIVPLALALIVGGLLVWKLPRTYQATTTIAVSAARLAPNLVGAVAMDRSERMHAVSQQLLSRTVLERTARLEHLDQDGSIESAISRIRGSVSVTPSDSITPTGDPRHREQVAVARTEGAARHLSGVGASTTRRRTRSGSSTASRRCSSRRTAGRAKCARRTRRNSSRRQLQASGTRLNALEARLRTMKESFMGRLPEQTNANLAMVSAMQRQLESNATTRPRRAGSAVDDRAADRGDAAGRRQRRCSPTKGTPGEAAAVRVQTLRRELADAQLTYTDKHPEVVRLKDELATAEKAAAAERARPAADRVASLNATPEYRQLQKDREMPEDADLRAAAPADGDHRAGRAVPGARRRRAARRAADGLAAARVRPRARHLLGPVAARSRRRCSTRSCSASRAASSSRSWCRPACPPSRSSRSRCA